MAEREGFEPERTPRRISKLLMSQRFSSPEIPLDPRIWHSIWHRRKYTGRRPSQQAGSGSCVALRGLPTVPSTVTVMARIVRNRPGRDLIAMTSQC